jgi:hypothetical protein
MLNHVYNIDVIVLENILVIEFLWKLDFFKQFIFTKTMPIIELKSYSNIQTELQFQFNISGIKSNQIIEQSNIQICLTSNHWHFSNSELSLKPIQYFSFLSN